MVPPFYQLSTAVNLLLKSKVEEYVGDFSLTIEKTIRAKGTERITQQSD